MENEDKSVVIIEENLENNETFVIGDNDIKPIKGVKKAKVGNDFIENKKTDSFVTFIENKQHVFMVEEGNVNIVENEQNDEVNIVID